MSSKGITIATVVAISTGNVLLPGSLIALKDYLPASVQPHLQQIVVGTIAVYTVACIYLLRLSQQLKKGKRLLSFGHWPVALFLVVALGLPFIGGVKSNALELVGQSWNRQVMNVLIEELFYRFLVIELLLVSFNRLQTAIIAGLLFGTVHISAWFYGHNPMSVVNLILSSTVFGFGLAAIRLHGTGLFWLIVFHLLSNFTIQVSDTMNTMGRNTHYWIVKSTELTVFVAGVFLFVRERLQKKAQRS